MNIFSFLVSVAYNSDLAISVHMFHLYFYYIIFNLWYLFL